MNESGGAKTAPCICLGEWPATAAQSTKLSSNYQFVLSINRVIQGYADFSWWATAGTGLFALIYSLPVTTALHFSTSSYSQAPFSALGMGTRIQSSDGGLQISQNPRRSRIPRRGAVCVLDGGVGLSLQAACWAVPCQEWSAGLGKHPEWRTGLPPRACNRTPDGPRCSEPFVMAFLGHCSLSCIC